MSAVREEPPVVMARPVSAGPATTRRSGWRGWADRRAGVLAAILAWLGFTGWLRPLSLPDEGRYVGVAWEMLRSGDWLVPTLDGLPFFHKPPLFYWITAGSMSLFGAGNWAARVAPWLGAAAVAFGLYLFTRRWAGPRMARASLLVLLTQPLFFLGAQYANLDMLIAGCIGVTILAGAHAVQCLRVGLPYRGWLVAAYGLAGLGVLAKGLIGVVLPVAVLLLWLAWSQPWRRALGVSARLVSLSGLVAFLAVAAPWFVEMQARFPDFFHYFFVVQHFQRFAGGGFNNVRPFWFFVPVLLLLTLPWSAWSWALRGRSKPSGEDRVHGDVSDGSARVASPVAARAMGVEPDTATPRCSLAVRQLMWAWLAVIVVFFSIPGSKLVGYILPVCAPLAFLVAEAARGAWDRPAASAWWRRSAALAALLCVVSVGIVLGVDHSSTQAVARAYVEKSRLGEPLVMLDDYFYDVPLHAAVRGPVRVVGDWSNPTIGSRDNWQKEMADAATFAPDRGASVLIDLARLPALLCESPVHWLIASPDHARRHDWLASLPPVASSRKASLWRVDRADPRVAAALACPVVSPARRR